MVGVVEMEEMEIAPPSPPSPARMQLHDAPSPDGALEAAVLHQDLQAEPLPPSAVSALPVDRAPPLLQLKEDNELQQAGTVLECALATGDYPFDELECLEVCMDAILDISQMVSPKAKVFFMSEILPNCANTVWQRANVASDTAERMNRFLQRLIEFLVATMLEKDLKLLQVLAALLVQSSSGFYHTQGRQKAEIVHGDAEAAQPGGSFIKKGSWTVSRYVIENIMCFATAGGFSRFSTILHEPNVAVPVIKLILKPMSQLRELLAPAVVEQMLTQSMTVVFDRLLGLTVEETKAADRGDLQSIKLYLQLLIHSVPSFSAQPLELFSLQLALKLLKSSTLEKRLAGLKDITTTLKSVQQQELTRVGDEKEKPKTGVKRWLSSSFLVKWLRGERIVELIYVENVHPEILQRSADLLIFLSTARELSIEDLDALWSAGEGKHESIVHIVYVLIGTVCNSLDLEHIEYLFAAKLQQLPYSAFTIPTVTLLRSLSIAAISTTEKATEPILPEDSRFHGIRFAWDLLQDKNSSAISKELKGLAMAVVRDFLGWPLCYPLRETFLLACIENLNRFTSVSVSLKVLQLTLTTYTAEGPEKVASIIFELNEKHRLLAVIFYALTEYKRNVGVFLESLGEAGAGLDFESAIFCGTAPHKETMEDFLSVLRFSLCQSHLSLGRGHVDQLWECLVEQATSDADRNSAFEWLEAIRIGSNPGMAPFTVDEASHLLLEKVPTLELSELSLTAFEFVHGYFYFVNWSNGCLPDQVERALPDTVSGDRPALSSSLIGVDIIWTIALSVVDEKASARAVSFLCSLYKTPEARKSIDGHIEQDSFISTCFSKLSAAAALLSVGKPESLGLMAEETCVKRCLLMLRTVVEEFVASAKSSAPGHGSLSQGTPLSLKVSGAVKPTTLSLFSNDSVATLRDLIAAHQEVAAGCIRMFVTGKELKQLNQTLSKAGVHDQFTITVGLRPAPLESDDVDMDANCPVSHQGPRQILSRPIYFEQLFSLLTLDEGIARSTWDLILLLPTNTQMLRDLGPGGIAADDWSKFLDAHSVYKLLYSLQILEHLLEQDRMVGTWQEWFSSKGGVAHLLQVLTRVDVSHTSSNLMRKSCSAQLLQFLCQYCLTPGSSSGGACATVQELHFGVRLRGRHLLESVEPASSVVDQLMHLCWSVASGSAEESSGSLPDSLDAEKEAEIIKYALLLLTAACVQEEDLLLHMWSQQRLSDWLLLLLGTTLNESVRSFAAEAIIALCGPRLPQDLARQSYTHFMRSLIGLLPQIPSDCHTAEQLYDLIHVMIGQSFDKDHAADLPSAPEELFATFVSLALDHPIVEASSSDVDFVLAGLMKLLTLLIEHEPSLNDLGNREIFQKDGAGRKMCLVDFVFYSCLFEIPIEGSLDPSHKQPPLCKSGISRTAAFDLLVGLCGEHEGNFLLLLEQLCNQHSTASSRSEWQYSPSDQVRAKCGFVGLVNQGATCYMNSLLQQLFMTPAFRSSLMQLSIKKPDEGKPTEEERRDSVLYQLQLIFAKLQESTKRSCDTIGLCQAYRDYDGLPVNPGLQMDAEEFCNMLFDKLEMAMKGTNQENLVSKHFAGELCNQVISRDCGHVSETIEPFYSLSVAVKGKNSLQESLELYVEGDMLDGDNKYHCGKCDAKVSALKRCCVRTLPETLLVHMRRFEFNLEHMQRMKVNDRCTFPFDLDMEPYTKQGLSEKEGAAVEADRRKPKEYFQYELAGVLVHTGTADSGHYYSYIKDRSGMGRTNDGEPKEGGWYKFNDQIVDEWDVATIARDCFGGFETTMQWDATYQKHVPQVRHFVNNAYMLVYLRTATASPCSAVMLRRNSELCRRVWQDNEQFWRDNYLFDSHYFAMMRRVCLVKNDDSVVQLKLVKMAAKFYVGVLCRAAEQDIIGSFVSQLKDLFTASEEACIWFLGAAVEKGYIEQLLLICPSSRTRQLTASLFIHTLACVTQTTRQFLTLRSARAQELTLQPCDLAPLSITADTAPTSILFINQCLNLLPSAQTHWRRFGQIFAPVRAFAKFGEAERAYLLSVSAISRLGDFYLAKDSPFAEVSSKPSQMGDQFGAPRVQYLVDTISDLARSCQTAAGSPRAPSPYFGPPKVPEATAKFTPTVSDQDASVPRLPAPLAMGAMDQTMLTTPAFYVRVFSDGINGTAACSLLQHMVWNNEALSVSASSALVSAMSTVAEDKVTGLLEAIESILEVDDAHSEGRCHLIMSSLIGTVSQSAFPGSSATVVRYFAVISREQAVVQSWLLENLNNWLPKWLIEHRNDQVRFAALELAQVFLEDTEPLPAPQPAQPPSYEEALSTPPTPHVELPIAQPLSLLCVTRTRAVLQSLLLLLGTTALANIHCDEFTFQRRELQRPGTSTAYYSNATYTSSGYKLVPYFQLLTACLVDDSMRSLVFEMHSAGLTQLFEAIEALNLPTDHNKREMILFWDEVFAATSEERLAEPERKDGSHGPMPFELPLRPSAYCAFVTEQDSVTSLLLDFFISLDSQETQVSFNRMALPAYYRLLLRCGLYSSVFLRKLITSKNFKWATLSIYLSIDYPEVSDVFYHILAVAACEYPEFRVRSITRCSTADRERLSFRRLISFVKLLLVKQSEIKELCLAKGPMLICCSPDLLEVEARSVTFPAEGVILGATRQEHMANALSVLVRCAAAMVHAMHSKEAWAHDAFRYWTNMELLLPPLCSYLMFVRDDALLDRTYHLLSALAALDRNILHNLVEFILQEHVNAYDATGSLCPPSVGLSSALPAFKAHLPAFASGAGVQVSYYSFVDSICRSALRVLGGDEDRAKSSISLALFCLLETLHVPLAHKRFAMIVGRIWGSQHLASRILRSHPLVDLLLVRVFDESEAHVLDIEECDHLMACMFPPVSTRLTVPVVDSLINTCVMRMRHAGQLLSTPGVEKNAAASLDLSRVLKTWRIIAVPETMRLRLLAPNLAMVQAVVTMVREFLQGEHTWNAPVLFACCIELEELMRPLIASPSSDELVPSTPPRP